MNTNISSIAESPSDKEYPTDAAISGTVVGVVVVGVMVFFGMLRIRQRKRGQYDTRPAPVVCYICAPMSFDVLYNVD